MGFTIVPSQTVVLFYICFLPKSQANASWVCSDLGFICKAVGSWSVSHCECWSVLLGHLLKQQALSWNETRCVGLRTWVTFLTVSSAPSSATWPLLPTWLQFCGSVRTSLCCSIHQQDLWMAPSVQSGPWFETLLLGLLPTDSLGWMDSGLSVLAVAAVDSSPGPWPSGVLPKYPSSLLAGHDYCRGWVLCAEISIITGYAASRESCRCVWTVIPVQFLPLHVGTFSLGELGGLVLFTNGLQRASTPHEIPWECCKYV